MDSQNCFLPPPWLNVFFHGFSNCAYGSWGKESKIQQEDSRFRLLNLVQPTTEIKLCWLMRVTNVTSYCQEGLLSQQSLNLHVGKLNLPVNLKLEKTPFHSVPASLAVACFNNWWYLQSPFACLPKKVRKLRSCLFVGKWLFWTLSES